jgi:hypothetical protein
MMERLRAVTGHNSGKDKHKVIGKVAPGDGEEGLKYMKDLWQALIDEEFGGRYKVTCTCHNMAAKKQVGCATWTWGGCIVQCMPCLCCVLGSCLGVCLQLVAG